MPPYVSSIVAVAKRGLHRSPEVSASQAFRRVLEVSTAGASDESPVFLCAAGWRTGSSALQRVLLDAGIMMWGEPYGRACPVRNWSRTFAAFSCPDWPNERKFVDARFDLRDRVPADVDTPNLYPSVHDLVEAHRSLTTRLFRDPAERRGYRRWGIKEVRFTDWEILLLHALYPEAKFVFLVRNPLDAWRSFRAHLPALWYDQWPTPVLTPVEFARHWRRCAESFLQLEPEVEGIVIRHEELTDDLAAIGEHLGVELDSSILDHRLRSTRAPTLPRWEAAIIRRRTEPVARSHGYDI